MALKIRPELTRCLWIGSVLTVLIVGISWIHHRFGGLYSKPGSFANREVESPAIDFAMSPIRDEMVFVGAGHGGSDLFILDLRTRRVRSLITSPDTEYDPAYSRSGRELVFARSRPTERFSTIAIYDFRSSKAFSIPHVPHGSDQGPSFSPDGSVIVFARAARCRTNAWGGYTWDMWDIYMMRRDGTQVTRVTNGSFYSISSPHFSSDGKSICFSASLYNGLSVDARMFSVNAAPGASPVPISAALDASYPEYSKHGDQILFISDVTGTQDYDVLESSVTGINVHKYGIVKQSAYNVHPHYSPDGNSIYFLADPNPQNRPRLRLWRLDRRKCFAAEFAGPELFEMPLKFVNRN